MSSATMAILTIGVVPLAGVLPLLTEHIREEQIAHISLLGEMTPDEVMAEYAVGDGEKGLLTLLSNNQLVMVSRQKIERDVRSAIAMLDRQHYDVILLLSSEQLTGFTTHHAILLEPQRIIPPLVASIVDGHRRGDRAGGRDHAHAAAKVALAGKVAILRAGQSVYRQRQRAINRRQNAAGAGRRRAGPRLSRLLSASSRCVTKALDVPVLLSNVLVSRLAAELLV